MDSKSIGLCPQGLESPRCRLSSQALVFSVVFFVFLFFVLCVLFFCCFFVLFVFVFCSPSPINLITCTLLWLCLEFVFASAPQWCTRSLPRVPWLFCNRSPCCQFAFALPRSLRQIPLPYLRVPAHSLEVPVPLLVLSSQVPFLSCCPSAPRSFFA